MAQSISQIVGKDIFMKYEQPEMEILEFMKNQNVVTQSVPYPEIDGDDDEIW